jgi:hypothetical protein
MRVWAATLAASVVAAVVSTGCGNPFGRKYEYEEQVYLRVNGSATVVIDASIQALVALRNLPLDPSAPVAIDRDQVRAVFRSSGCGDVSVGQPWIRSGRRFVQVQVDVQDLRGLESCGPLAWSSYRFERDATSIRYEQTVGAPTPGKLGQVNWDGSELVAFKLHAPSRITHHNVKRLEDGANGKPSRGNILTWEQRLEDRRKGQPVQMEVRMGSESILFRTLWLFAGAFAAAVGALVAMIWWTIRRASRSLKKPAT